MSSINPAMALAREELGAICAYLKRPPDARVSD